MPIDLNKLIDVLGTAELGENENPEARASRLRREEADAYHARWRRTGLYVVVGLLAVLTAGLACFLMLSSTTTREQKEWGQTALTHLATALLAFLGGKNLGSGE